MKCSLKKDAGVGSGFTDEEYVQAGAKIVETAEEAWNQGYGYESKRTSCK